MHYKIKNLVNTHRDFNTGLSEEKWLAANVVGFAAGIYSLHKSIKNDRGLLAMVSRAAIAYNVIGSLVTIKEQIVVAKEQWAMAKAEQMLRRGVDEADLSDISREDIRDAAVQIAKNLIHGDKDGLVDPDPGENHQAGLGYPTSERNPWGGWTDTVR